VKTKEKTKYIEKGARIEKAFKEEMEWVRDEWDR
jgi:2-hydroxy-3-keto-5-methylthiopentenyl-1-phosphate phosphatase